MVDPIRKPRVFLSHSKRDLPLIRRLDSDLRACQLDPWLDEFEMRHGKPWLDEIFGAGIPSCEVVLCYLTEYSVHSPVVRQEIDARLIRRFQDDRIGLLPYVSRESVRESLRPDLQLLQVPEFNELNYDKMLPRVVSQIWRVYAEWASAQASQRERAMRLEAEIELRDTKELISQHIFTPREAKEFAFIWSQLDLKLDSHVTLFNLGGRNTIQARMECTVDVGMLYRSAIATQKYHVSEHAIEDYIKRIICKWRGIDPLYVRTDFRLPFDIESRFLVYGFLTRNHLQKDAHLSVRVHAHSNELHFTDKFDRFNYWIELEHPLTDAAGPALIIRDDA